MTAASRVINNAPHVSRAKREAVEKARTDPPLTTVHQPIRALGGEMARMLIALLAGQQPSSRILPSRLHSSG
jgi:DNA-binding LacI/PurR family transcriptional regulator